MPKIAVYKYLVMDESTKQWRKQPGYGTRAHVDSIGGALIFGTKIEVAEEEIRDGVYLDRFRVRSS